MLTPPSLSHACSTEPMSKSGKPDAKPIKNETSIRPLKIAASISSQVSRSGSTATARRGCLSGKSGGLRGRTALCFERVVVIDRQRSVVRKPLLFVDGTASCRCGDTRGCDLVIDTPAHILRPRLTAIRPPGVLIGPTIDTSEYIDPAELVEHTRKPRTLLGQKARVLPIAPPVPEINLVVSDVPVAT